MDLIICMSLISQLRDLKYLGHLKSKSPFFKGLDLNPQHLLFNYGKWNKPAPGFVSHSPDNSVKQHLEVAFSA